MAPIAIVIATASGAPPSSKLNQPPPGFDALFNGRNLDGWCGFTGDFPARAEMSEAQRATSQAAANERMQAHWHVEEGHLAFDSQGKSLVTCEDFGDF
ncbi:MAG: 3-keto-disaccharide hydrolase, partial [Planctomycetota bacterium]